MRTRCVMTLGSFLFVTSCLGVGEIDIPMRAGFVSIVGRPNVGKSTLLNRLVGQKVAIVTPKPQTTRNRILAIANRPGAQMVFFDTPGIHKPRHAMDRLMVETAVQSLKQVDLVLLLVDIEQPFGRGDEHVLELIKNVDAPVILGINKIDAKKKHEILPLIDTYRREHDFVEIVPFSALTGDNVDRLEEVLVKHLPEGEALYPEETLTDLPERFFIAEMVREQILRLTRHEVPHSTAVIVDAWEDRPGLTSIEASIIVERDSQKVILLGRGGNMMKKIGTAAREEAEKFLGTKVYLGLHVKVRARWRENRRILSDLGIDR